MKKIIIRSILGIVAVILILAAYLFITIQSAMKITEGQPIAKYDTVKSALLVIDIQEGTTGGYSVTKGYINQREPFLAAVNSVIEKADTSGITIIYIKNETTNWLFNLLGGNILAEGDPSAEFDKDLKVINQNQFSKNVLDAFTNPQLDKFLIENQINHLYITGLDAAYCAGAATQAALNRGYKITLIEDALLSETKEIKAEKINKLEELGITIINANKF